MNIKQTERITIRIDAILYNWLIRRAEDRRETITDLVREAIYLYMEGIEHEKN